jgi:hypothetical protein
MPRGVEPLTDGWWGKVGRSLLGCRMDVSTQMRVGSVKDEESVELYD